MRTIIKISISFFLIISIAGAQEYLGETPPGTVPVAFAPYVF